MTPASANPLELQIDSDPAALKSVRQQVEPFALALGYDEEIAGQILLALDEALTNVIRHAYQGQTDQPIHITLAAHDGHLAISVRDFGRTCDPATIRSRDLDDIRPGGLGVHIIHECMDRVEYLPADNGRGTTLHMHKALPGPTESEDAS
jgi:serine/threonine-protein kinase RsbW